MNIAIIITHNKSDQDNFDQIEAIKSVVETVTETKTNYDFNGNPVGTYEVSHYEIKNLGVAHEVKFYQILPFGANKPSNFLSLDSHNVLYGKGDEDKKGDHPRFFNWGLKRATDYGADIVIHLEDHTKFSVGTLASALATLTNVNNKLDYLETPASKLTTLDLLKIVGQLDEMKTKPQALQHLKQRIIQKGIKYG